MYAAIPAITMISITTPAISVSVSLLRPPAALVLVVETVVAVEGVVAVVAVVAVLGVVVVLVVVTTMLTGFKVASIVMLGKPGQGPRRRAWFGSDTPACRHRA
jgi:hypothetical protein